MNKVYKLPVSKLALYLLLAFAAGGVGVFGLMQIRDKGVPTQAASFNGSRPNPRVTISPTRTVYHPSDNISITWSGVVIPPNKRLELWLLKVNAPPLTDPLLIGADMQSPYNTSIQRILNSGNNNGFENVPVHFCVGTDEDYCIGSSSTFTITAH